MEIGAVCLSVGFAVKELARAPSGKGFHKLRLSCKLFVLLHHEIDNGQVSEYKYLEEPNMCAVDNIIVSINLLHEVLTDILQPESVALEYFSKNFFSFFFSPRQPRPG